MSTAPALWAAAPIALLLLLMIGRGWSAARAGLAGLALAVVLALVVFDFGAGGFVTRLQALVGVGAEGLFIALTILWILWPALALHEHQQTVGALDALRATLARMHPDPRIQALYIGWFLALFLEGAAGFGTPVALAAPLLVALGCAPVQAVLLALLGHAIGVCFGALGTPVATQVALTGLDGSDIAWRTAVLAMPLAAILMVFFVRELGRGVRVDDATHASVLRAGAGGGLWPTAALAWLAFQLPMLAVAFWLGPELPTLAGALLGAALLLPWLAWRRTPAVVLPGNIEPGRLNPAAALAPYLVLVALVLVTRAWPAIRDVLGGWQLQWRLWEHYHATMQPLLHPGTLLMLALLLGAPWQRGSLRTIAPALARSARRLAAVSVALVAMLCLSRLMLHAGMIEALQQAAVSVLGGAWPLFAPALGALGSFVTGSATASSVLFMPLQAQVAQAMALPPAWLAAAQGVGAAVGNIVCPHNLVAGAATVGLAGREGAILRRTALPALIVLVVAGVLVFVLVHAGGAAV
jgi:lactate permease